MTAQTLKDALNEAFRSHPEKNIYHIIDDQLEVTSSLSYGHIFDFAGRMRTKLDSLEITSERVCLSVMDNEKFILLFFACVLNDITMVPAHPPLYGRKSHRLRGIIDDSGVSTLVTDAASLPLYESKDLQFTSTLTYEGIQDQPPSPLDGSPASEDDILVIQYTSGSTSSPKGVILTNKNIITNSWIIGRAFNSIDGDIDAGVGLTWLPVYHDMGLIGNVIQASIIAKPLYVMDTLSFIRNPLSWLKAIDKFRIDISGGPNFAYRAVVRRLGGEQDLNLDLSCWRVAYCGAEPIDPVNLDQFSEMLCDQGFRPEALTPCYGLAECTLMVTTESVDAPFRVLERRIGDDPASSASKHYVSCGKVTGDTSLLIADEEGRPLPEDSVGEILVAGDSVMPGYLNVGELDYFVHHHGKTYFQTGDVGFLRDENLYVVGRIKDSLIINGTNIYAVDVEGILAEELEPLRGKVLAAHQDEDGVRLHVEVPAEEVEALKSPDFLRTVRASTYRNFGFVFQEVLLYPEFSLPRTTSGKIRRPKCLKVKSLAYTN